MIDKTKRRPVRRMPHCPACDQPLTDGFMVSRADGVTRICPPCGIFERQHADELTEPGLVARTVVLPVNRLQMKEL